MARKTAVNWEGILKPHSSCRQVLLTALSQDDKLSFDKMHLTAPIQEDGAAAKFQWQTIKKTMACKSGKINKKQCHQK